MPRRLALLPQHAAGSAEVVGQTGGEGAIEGVPVGVGDHQDVAGAALLGHDRHQSVSTEPDRRQPNVLGHGEKLPAGGEIVKSPCRALFCWRSAGDPSGPGSPRPATRSAPHVRRSRSFLMAIFGGLFLAACSNGTGPGGGPSLDCTTAVAEALAVGEHRILDPNQNDACVRLPPAGPAGAEYPLCAGCHGGDRRRRTGWRPTTRSLGLPRRPRRGNSHLPCYPRSGHRSEPLPSTPCFESGNEPSPGARRWLSSTRGG